MRNRRRPFGTGREEEVKLAKKPRVPYEKITRSWEHLDLMVGKVEYSVAMERGRWEYLQIFTDL